MPELNDKKTGPSFGLHSHIVYNFIVLVTGIIVVFGIPPFILQPVEAKQIFNNGRAFEALAFMIIFAAFIQIIVAAIYWILVTIRLKFIGALFVVFLFNWVVLAAFLFPLTTATGAIPFISSPTNYGNLAMVLIASVALTVLWHSRHAKAVIAAMTVFILIAVLPTIPRMFSDFDDHYDHEAISLSTERNIILISFDGLPGEVAKQVLENNDELKNEFADFTFFENASSTSPATVMSQLGIIHGNHDFSDWNKTKTIDWRELFFNDRAKYDMYTSFTFNTFNQHGTEIPIVENNSLSQSGELLHFYKSVALRLSTSVGARVFENFQRRYFGRTVWRFSKSVDRFDRMTAEMTSGNSRSGVLFLHYGFTHFPIKIDENCQSKAADLEWIDTHQNEKGIEVSTQCAMRKYSEFVQKLKSIGSYEKSTIFLISDHGQPTAYFSSPPQNLTINGNREYGYIRYRPLLMVKGPNARQNKLKYNDKIVLLDDIAQTSCYVAENSPDCEKLPGLDLLNELDEAPKEFFIHVGLNEKSNNRPETQTVVRLSREIPLLEAMQATDEIVLAEDK